LQALFPVPRLTTRPTKDCRCKAALRAASTNRISHMMKTLLMSGAAALVFMTTNAVADGMPGRRPVVVPTLTPNWTGFYLGVGVGGAFATHDHSAKYVREQRDGSGVQVVDTLRLWDLDNGDGRFFGTATLGYDQLFSSHWLAGVFVDYDFGNGDSNSRFDQVGRFNDVRLSHGHDHAWSVGGRLGFLSSPSTLLYVSTGWTRISVDGDISFTDIDTDTQLRRSFDSDRDGWFVGAGIETQLGWLGSNWSLRGEYRFTQFDDDDRKLTLDGISCGEACTFTRRLEHDHDIDVHSVRLVLAYKFGRREAPAPLK
jgi:outer membrane immunogenic protein